MASRAPSSAGPRHHLSPVVVVSALVALVALAVLGMTRQSAAPAAAESTTLPPSPAPAPAAPKATATLHVDTEPSGAKVNEEGETMCASTPCDIVYLGAAADPSAEHLLAFLLPGYKLERKVVTATGAPVSVKLTKAR